MITFKTEFGVSHYHHLYPKGIERHYWQIARNKTLLKEIKKFIEPNDRILEVGCGRGDVVSYFRQHGLDCWGVELAAEVPVIETVQDFITINEDSVRLPESFRDTIRVITLFDVIEHLPDPVDFLHELKANFSQLNHLVITVPACQEIWSNYDEFNGHYRRYNLEMVRNHAESIGAALIENRYFFKMLYPPARILKLLGKNRSHDLKGPKSGFAKWIHRMTAQGSLILDAVTPSFIKGSSILSVLKI